MRKELIQKAVVDTLKEMVGNLEINILLDTKPTEHCGLDSQDGIEFAIYICDKLKCAIPNDVNPFIDDTKKQSRPRTVGDIVELISTLSEGQN